MILVILLPYAPDIRYKWKFKSMQLRFFQPYMEVDLRNGKLKETKNGDYMKVSSTVHFLDKLKRLYKLVLLILVKCLVYLKVRVQLETPLVHYINNDND